MYLYLALLFSYSCFSQWQTYQTPANVRFQDVCAVDQNIIWACGANGTVVKTTNGGQNWSVYYVYQHAALLGHISAVDNNYAWVAGDTNFRKVYRTTDGANSWIQQSYSQPYFINNIHFFNVNTGIFLRDPLTPPSNDTAGFFITRNGGLNWYRSPNPPRTTLLNDNCMFALDTNFVCFTNNQFLYKLTNGLDNVWQKIQVVSGPFVNNAYFINSQTGYVGQWDFKMHKTIDGGLSWSTISTDTYLGYLEFLFLPNTNLAFICAYNQIRVSTNNGVNWDLRVTYNSADSVNLGLIDAYDSNSVWLACNKGRLLKYNINYIGIEPAGSGEVPQAFSLSQNYPNPFNPVTKIKFDIPVPLSFGEGLVRKDSFGGVRLIIYDILGREAAILVNESLMPGVYEVEFDGSNFSSGVYYYQLTTIGFTTTKKMILLR